LPTLFFPELNFNGQFAFRDCFGIVYFKSSAGCSFQALRSIGTIVGFLRYLKTFARKPNGA
jgi:hypothetical protein